jgi:ectoine hydroxylase-related dioxygenase (phytanoyl-CoA dioxygenase family)
LTVEQRQAYERDGFVRLDGFVEHSVGAAMLERVVELARRAADGEDIKPAFVMLEAQTDLDRGPAVRPEDVVSKIFRLARDPVFRAFAVQREVTDLVADLLGTDDDDNFLSQFIFKNAGAWGQPWHQDSFYFPFEPARPVVGVWLAVTEATLANGCLHVLPGSHREPVHEHIADRRPDANLGYVEIVDHDMSDSVPVLMAPGDLLLFDSHLMHRSTDNGSDGLRAAMVYHYAAAGTVDRTEDLLGYTVNDWLPARRAGQATAPTLDAVPAPS